MADLAEIDAVEFVAEPVAMRPVVFEAARNKYRELRALGRVLNSGAGGQLNAFDAKLQYGLGLLQRRAARDCGGYPRAT